MYFLSLSRNKRTEIPIPRILVLPSGIRLERTFLFTSPCRVGTLHIVCLLSQSALAALEPKLRKMTDFRDDGEIDPGSALNFLTWLSEAVLSVARLSSPRNTQLVAVEGTLRAGTVDSSPAELSRNLFQITIFCCKSAISPSFIPNSRKTSTLCSLRTGGGRENCTKPPISTALREVEKAISPPFDDHCTLLREPRL